MQELFLYQKNLLYLADARWHRYLYPELKKKTRLLGLKRLLGVIAHSVPFEPNISRFFDRLHVNPSSVYSYLNNLKDTHIFLSI